MTNETQDIKQDAGLPSAEQMRGITRSPEQIFEDSITTNMHAMLQEMAQAANAGHSSHTMNINIKFPQNVLAAIVTKFETLGYVVASEEAQMTPEIKVTKLTVSWAA